jgi:KUP system potassium uptake protein
MTPTPSPSEQPRGHSLLFLCLTALGVVYGDIGTSPLYALRFCFSGEHGVDPSRANVLGVLSLVLWSLILVISIKYLVFVLRADNRGEGGIMALMALLHPQRADIVGRRRRILLVMLGLFGAALLYGDGMITPAISVLSAVEGLHVATPLFDPYVIPITIVILIGLFVLQSGGTSRVGSLFGPIVFLWFITIGTLGVAEITTRPDVLLAINPIYGVQFFINTGWVGYIVLGAVFLVVTGGEALYADMGHFGRKPIRICWFGLVLPGLLLNYFGQGALLLNDPTAARNPFFLLAPAWALYPLVVLSTAATVIASQAVISGVFSLTMQAIQLGYLPRVQIEHTSARHMGQIYISYLNWTLMVATVALVLAFGKSDDLAAAYGVAVSATMVITTILMHFAARELWGWRVWPAALMTTGFLIIDFSFLGTNLVKIEHGGWFPIVVAAIIYVTMSTWKRGRKMVQDRVQYRQLVFDMFLRSIQRDPPARVKGTAVFLTANPIGVPSALLHNLKHNKVLHERTVLLTMLVTDSPHVPPDQQLEIQTLGESFYRILARYGFMEEPDVPQLLKRCGELGLKFDLGQTTFFLGLETLIPSGHKPGMAAWRQKLFVLMARNAQRATKYFRLPPNRVIEVGVQVEL